MAVLEGMAEQQVQDDDCQRASKLREEVQVEAEPVAVAEGEAELEDEQVALAGPAEKVDPGIAEESILKMSQM